MKARIDYIIRQLDEVIRRQKTFEETVCPAVINLEKKYDMLSSDVYQIKEVVRPFHGTASHISVERPASNFRVRPQFTEDLKANLDDVVNSDDGKEKRDDKGDEQRNSVERTAGLEGVAQDPLFDNTEDGLQRFDTPNVDINVAAHSKRRKSDVQLSSSQPVRRSSRRLKHADDEVPFVIPFSTMRLYKFHSNNLHFCCAYSQLKLLFLQKN